MNHHSRLEAVAEDEEGLPRLGAFVVPLVVKEGDAAIDFAALEFASNRPEKLEKLTNAALQVRLKKLLEKPTKSSIEPSLNRKSSQQQSSGLCKRLNALQASQLAMPWSHEMHCPLHCGTWRDT